MASWRLSGASVIGPGHLYDGVPNQDSLMMRTYKGGFVSVVCDGMGSRVNSHIGSRAACKAVIETTKRSAFDLESGILLARIEQRWLDLINGVNPDSAITTCLFAWGDASGTVRAFQLGDGLILLRTGADKDFDSSKFGNETIGLGCKIDFSDWIVSELIFESGDTMGLMTDGISDDLIPGRESDFLLAVTEALENKNKRTAKKYLSNQLCNWGTPNHVDDKTITLISREK